MVKNFDDSFIRDTEKRYFRVLYSANSLCEHIGNGELFYLFTTLCVRDRIGEDNLLDC